MEHSDPFEEFNKMMFESAQAAEALIRKQLEYLVIEGLARREKNDIFKWIDPEVIRESIVEMGGDPDQIDQLCREALATI